mgnify:CR=1 FL=1
MNKIILLASALFLANFSLGQATGNSKLTELGKVYKNFMFRNEPNKNVFKDLKEDLPENLSTAAEFIIETITTDNKLLKTQYLSLPDEKVLKDIYIIRAISSNASHENPIDNNSLIDSLHNKTIPRYELIDSYYGMLFTAVGNKISPFNFSKVDFKLKEYNLTDDTEKGIFFLRCMDYCGRAIWGYMNIVKPANTKTAYQYIKKFPDFNGQPYYQFTDFNFPDFEMNIIQNEGLQSYKSYYIDKYYETLLSHLICLNKENVKDKDKNDLLLGSVLKERNLYKYTKYKETLEGIFKEQKKE